jgi:PAS domain S-box-containing protein
MGYLATPVRFTGTFLLSVAAMGAVLAALMRSPAVPGKRLGRYLFALGWAVFGATQVVAGLVPDDPSVALIAVKAVALAVIAATTLIDRTKLQGVRRLLLALGLLAISEGLMAGLAPATGSGGWYAAQALSIAGGTVLAAWLSAAFSVSIQFRFVTTFVSLLVVVIALISSAMTQVFAGNSQTEALGQVQREAQSLVRTFDADAKESITRARILSELPGVGSAVGQRDASLANIAKAFQVPGQMFDTSDFVAFIAPGGGLLAISNQGPDGPTLDALDTASLTGTAVVDSALRGLKAGSIDVMGSKLVVVGAAPVKDAKGQIVGVAAVGKVMNSRYLRSLPSDTKQEVSLVTHDAVVASTLEVTPKLDALVPEDERVAVFSDRETKPLIGTLRGAEAFGGLMPLAREDGKNVGVLLVQRASRVAALVQQDVGTRLYLFALASTLLAFLLSYVFGARIARPIVGLTKAAERVRSGDLATRVDVHGSGEVAVLGSAFNQMTESIGALTAAFRDAAEEEFRLRSRLQTILQSMTDGVIAVDLDGTIVAFNREAERMVGIGAEAALGRKVENVLAVEDPSGARMPLLFDGLHRESIRGVIASLATHDVPLKTPVAITSATVSDEQGNAMGLVAVVRDLTPEIEVERMKTEFLSNVSHELRTPLTPIKGYANLMIRREVPRSQAVNFLERIVESTDRLERIVGMLVDFAAMEAGRLVPKAVPVNLGSVVDQLMVRWEGASPKHRFVREGFTGLPLLHLDQRLVPRAIDELIDNAVKFSPDGGRVLVTAALDRRVPGAGSRLVRITVSDQGIGIAPDRLAGLGGGFVQVDASETREYGGLGLGLAYVRRIAESHGGYLEEPQSAPGRGSSFTIVLPAGLVDPSRPARPLLAGPPEPAKPSSAPATPPSATAGTPPSATATTRPPATATTPSAPSASAPHVRAQEAPAPAKSRPHSVPAEPRPAAPASRNGQARVGPQELPAAGKPPAVQPAPPVRRPPAAKDPSPPVQAPRNVNGSSNGKPPAPVMAKAPVAAKGSPAAANARAPVAANAKAPVAPNAKAGGTSTKGAPAKGAPAKGAPAKGAPAKGAPAKGAPAKGAPAKGVKRPAVSRPKVTIIHVPLDPSDMPPPRAARAKPGPDPRSTR